MARLIDVFLNDFRQPLSSKGCLKGAKVILSGFYLFYDVAITMVFTVNLRYKNKHEFYISHWFF